LPAPAPADRPGSIEVITGSMFSGKSEELIRRVRRAEIARQKVQVFKPRLDDRFAQDYVVSHSDIRFAAESVSSARELLEAVRPDTEVVAIAGDGSGDGNVALFDAGSGAPLPVAPITGLPLALEGNRIAVREANAITHRRISDGALLASVPATGVGPSAVKLEFESGLALVGALDGVTAIHFDDGVTGAACTVGALDASDTLTGVALSSDDQTLVTTSSEGIRQVWDAATGALESTPPPSDLVVPSATSPDGRMIAIPDAASTFHVEDTTTGEVIWTFGPHPTRVTALDWGGVTRIASTAEREPVDRWAFEPSVRVWSTTLVTMEQALPGIDNGPALFDSTLGRLFVTGRSSVTRWCK